MPGHSTGAHPKPHTHSHTYTHSSGRSRADGYRQSAGNHHTEQPRRTAHHHANGRGSETLGFIPGSAGSTPVTPACGSCSSLGWSGCRALLCCVLTCGLYAPRRPCLPPPNESSTDAPPKPEPQPRPINGTSRGSPTCGVAAETGKPRPLPSSDSFRYQDVCIAGRKVEYPVSSAAPPRRGRGSGGNQRPVSSTSVYSREELDLDELSDSGTDIDSLITRKLLELYKLHQIEQLAKCTSDSSFSRKTNEISELINSIAQDYNLQEQEAECRLVHGVIRISTRKSRTHHRPKDYTSHDALQQTNGRRDGTLPDSGNATMTYSLSSMEPEVKVSELTRSDELARRMRAHSGRGYSSGSTYSPYQHETDLSGEPLLL